MCSTCSHLLTTSKDSGQSLCVFLSQMEFLEPPHQAHWDLAVNSDGSMPATKVDIDLLLGKLAPKLSISSDAPAWLARQVFFHLAMGLEEDLLSSTDSPARMSQGPLALEDGGECDDLQSERQVAAHIRAVKAKVGPKPMHFSFTRDSSRVGGHKILNNIGVVPDGSAFVLALRTQ